MDTPTTGEDTARDDTTRYARGGHGFRDVLGYCVWLGSLPLGLALLLALEWLLDLDLVMVAVLCAIPLFLWARFVWTRVVKPFLERRKTTVEALRKPYPIRPE